MMSKHSVPSLYTCAQEVPAGKRGALISGENRVHCTAQLLPAGEHPQL